MSDYYFIDAEELKKRITSKCCKGCEDNGKNWCTHICDVHDILKMIDDMIEEVNSEDNVEQSDTKETNQ